MKITPEIELVQKYGKLLKIYHISIYRVKNLFKEFVEFFYDLKVHYKKIRNKINAEVYYVML